jgi:heme-degrading monooxygenase HmoA
MIYEIVQLPVHKEHTGTFRQAFAEVVHFLKRAPGYRGHLLAQGIEHPELFRLIVRWRSLNDHTPVFEASEDHAKFMMVLQEYFSEEPHVYHVEQLELSGPFFKDNPGHRAAG